MHSACEDYRAARRALRHAYHVMERLMAPHGDWTAKEAVRSQFRYLARDCEEYIRNHYGIPLPVLRGRRAAPKRQPNPPPT